MYLFGLVNRYLKCGNKFMISYCLTCNMTLFHSNRGANGFVHIVLIMGNYILNVKTVTI